MATDLVVATRIARNFGVSLFSVQRIFQWCEETDLLTRGPRGPGSGRGKTTTIKRRPLSRLYCLGKTNSYSSFPPKLSVNVSEWTFRTRLHAAKLLLEVGLLDRRIPMNTRL